MRNVRRRLALHFTYQTFLLFVFVLLLTFAIFLFVLQLVVNNELKRTYPNGALDGIVLETIVSENKAIVSKRWVKQLADHHYWLQIVNHKGNVIYSTNTPKDLPLTYELGELMRIEDTGRFRSYDVMMATDDSVENSALYMMGYRDDGANATLSLFETYETEGLIAEADIATVDNVLQETKRTLHIVDNEGTIVQSAGIANDIKRYKPLELILMKRMQGNYPTDISIFIDTDSEYMWLLHEEKKGEYVKEPFMKDVIVFVSVFGIIVLLSTVVISIYLGYRYGRPLLLFIGWFDRLGRGKLEALSDKERKKLYRKSGKLRSSYKLYQEMIDGFYDMTEKLNAIEQDRIRLDKTREEWMTGISHDLRTPLSSIQGYGHLLESGQFQWTDEELKDMGATIREKSDFLIDLIQDFSLAFQLKNKQLPFVVNKIEVGEFVRRIVLTFVNDKTMGQINFLYQGGTSPIYVEANDKWFTRMLNNIIVNAVKHNPAGTTVTIITRQEQGNAKLIISDNGVGMDEETLSNLFERYYRGTNTDESSEGVGLGMSIAKSIALAHKGNINAESTIGKGSKVTLVFPIMDNRNSLEQ
ncbi:HAMP domain-containing histidine kinase [Paenibacillus sp. GSMTC-2017]|uniref:sensor histidine kinase n=1 Tax=Paenibacillus sp. GSMTC-2017 TaxID=2794350 RepID=UPI0018D9CAAF|nr:HAMP domain-containing sensor histidine kinase [Paenibacillus sp. GSMTC-2017]MBH5318603.1 HAMP domain-containing histidine kinase [Paenibacillus sp. GSMTC-2017]